MKKHDHSFFIGAILLIAGVVWAIATNRIGTTAGLLLFVGVVIGIVAEVIQGWVINQNDQGRIESGKRVVYIVGTIEIDRRLK
ncbi:hypothetical protein [Paenibacillus sp. SI8]|uniref:hypothetical protein n=1 Tax=unclassified Paenibacillus TaxID=185978 RepID=UPI0034664348